jgi:hypothetical protein
MTWKVSLSVLMDVAVVFIDKPILKQNTFAETVSFFLPFCNDNIDLSNLFTSLWDSMTNGYTYFSFLLFLTLHNVYYPFPPNFLIFLFTTTFYSINITLYISLYTLKLLPD